jgi:hypothetical protein
MPFLCLAVEDNPRPKSRRRYVERNSIALFTNFGRESINPPSAAWLGHNCGYADVCESGLWNSDHISEDHDPEVLTHLGRLVGHI